MQSFSGLEETEEDDGPTQARSHSRYGGRWDPCSACELAAGALLGGGQFLRLWQNHSSAVPKINTTPAGMPMTTGQGRELEAGVMTFVMGGFESERREREIKNINNTFKIENCGYVSFAEAQRGRIRLEESADYLRGGGVEVRFSVQTLNVRTTV